MQLRVEQYTFHNRIKYQPTENALSKGLGQVEGTWEEAALEAEPVRWRWFHRVDMVDKEIPGRETDFHIVYLTLVHQSIYPFISSLFNFESHHLWEDLKVLTF